LLNTTEFAIFFNNIEIDETLLIFSCLRCFIAFEEIKINDEWSKATTTTATAKQQQKQQQTSSGLS